MVANPNTGVKGLNLLSLRSNNLTNMVYPCIAKLLLQASHPSLSLMLGDLDILADVVELVDTHA